MAQIELFPESIRICNKYCKMRFSNYPVDNLPQHLKSKLWTIYFRWAKKYGDNK